MFCRVAGSRSHTETLGAMARDRAINGYDWNSVVQRTLALYEGVA